MRVLFDLYQVQYSSLCGVFKYATRILDGWYESGVDDVYILANDFYVSECQKRWPSYRVISVATPQSGYLRKALVAGLKRKKAIDGSECDVVFVPMFEPLFIAQPKLPVVMTVHDLQAFKVFKGKIWWYNVLCFPLHILRSKAIISITRYTESQLKQLCYYNEKKGVVVYNPILYDKLNYASIISGSYILCVNTIVDYKNQLTLVKAFASIKKTTDYKLVLVGNAVADYWKKIVQVIEEEQLVDRVIHLSNIKEEDLVSLYQHASLFVSPSTMEGFGQTPIEAAIYGCPVISSKCTALPETTMGLVQYYDPVMSENALADKIIEVLNNPPSKEEITRIANVYKESYDVKNQAMKIYDSLLNSYNS